MYDYQCTIVRVVDGDTVDVDIDLGFDTWRCGERIRLYGIDTPECRTRDAEDYPSKHWFKRHIHYNPYTGQFTRIQQPLHGRHVMIEYTVRVYGDRTEWWLGDQLHREGNLPAIEWAHGTKEYYKNGEWHRDGDLPAIEYASGTKKYYKNGKLHRDGDKPADESENGSKHYYKNGKMHRETGAALEWADGSKSYWLEGKQLTKKEWQERVNPVKELTVAEIEELLGHRVKVVK